MKKAASTPRPAGTKTAASPAARASKPRAPRAPRRKAAPGGAPAPWAPSDADIARRAYEIFLARDGEPGDSLADWLQAEEQLKAEHRLKSDA